MAQVPMSLAKPNAFNYLQSKQEEKPKINLFDFSSVKKPNYLNRPVETSGMSIKPKTEVYTPDFKPIQQTIQPTTQSSGYSLFPKANAGFNDGLTDKELKTLIEEGYSDIEIKKLNDDLISGAFKVGYNEPIEQQPKQVNSNLPGFDIGVKTGQAVSEFGKGLKFDAGNSLASSKNPAVSSFGNLIESLKFVGNIPGDTLQMVGDLGQAVSNPIGTAKDIKSLGESVIETGLNKVFGTDFYTSNEKRLVSEGVSKALKDNFGSLEKIQKTIIENPTDVLLTIQGGLNIAKARIKNPNIITNINKIEEAINPINILKTEGKIAQKVVGTLAKPITTPVKSVIQQGKTLLGKPGDTTGIQQAIRPYIKVKNGKVVRPQEQITREIERANELVKKSGDTPNDLQTYRQAIEKQLKGLGKEIEAKTKQPLTIDLTDTASKIRKLSQSKTVKLLDKAEGNKLTEIADNIQKGGRISVQEAEFMNQWINDVTKSIGTASETYKKGLNILVKDIRLKLDETLSKIPGEFKQIKKDYGALRNILGDTIRREIVYNRQNPEGLITSFGKIEGLSNVGGGILRLLGDPKGGLSQIGKGVLQNKIGSFIKTKNDPNYIIEQIFSKKGKNVNNTNINPTSTIKNNTNTTKPKVITPNKPKNVTPNKSTKKPTKIGGKTIKEKIGEGVDKIAEKVGGKTNLMENRGTGMSGKKDLIKEAKKYNSAGEFIKAQGKPVYHGSKEKIYEFKGGFEGNNEVNEVSRQGIFFANDRKIAKSYGEGATQTIGGGKVTESYLYPKKEFTINYKGQRVPFETVAFNLKELKQGGYDLVTIKGWRDGIGGVQKVVLNPKIIKTKEQLQEIYKKTRN